MRSATTLILLTIAIALGFGIYLIDTKNTLGPNQQSSNVLTHFQSDTVTKIQIKSDGIDTTLSKQGDLWFFEKPFIDRADLSTVSSILDLLNHLTIRDRIDNDEIQSNSQLSEDEIGFTKKDMIEVTLTSMPEGTQNTSGTKTSIQFGKAAPIANTIYARFDSKMKKSDAVYVVDGNPRKYLEDPATTLRDQTLLFAPVESLKTITIKTAKNAIKLARDNSSGKAKWVMLQPLSTDANSPLIERIIAQLSSLRVESLLDTNAAGSATPNPVPEGSVVIELQINGMEKVISVFLSPVKINAPQKASEKNAPLLEARSSDRPASFLVRSSLLEQIPSSPNAFRNPHLAHIPIQLLHSIIIQTRDNPNVILTAMPPANGQIQWKSDRNSKREAANLTKIVNLVNAVNEEKILSFTADSKSNLADYGLDRPFTAITFNIFQHDASSSDAQKPQTSQRTLALGHSKNDTSRLFASFVDEPYIYEVAPTFQNNVSPHPLKWKAPKVLSFSMLSLRQITRSKKDQEPIQLDYDYTQDLWTGTQSDNNISNKVDRRVALKLASTLGSLTAKDWITTSQLAYQALDTPALTIEVEIEEIDQALQEPKNVKHTLKFAPTTTGFYYGALDSSPDVFIIDRTTYRDLIQPLITNPTTLRPD